jgi:hypothetical protein
MDIWVDSLEKRVDESFLPWYFGYWNQQCLGLKSIGYWTLSKLFSNHPTAAERITENIQQEFSKRVLVPQVSQMQLEHILENTVDRFVKNFKNDLDKIPERYSIPQTEWDRYLSDIAIMTFDSNGNRTVPLSLKMLAGGTIHGTCAIAHYFKPLLTTIMTKIGTRFAAKGSSEAIALMARKTGIKVATKAGGKLAGPIICFGVIIWEVWDHQQTKKVESPILRENIINYLEWMKQEILYGTDSGLMSVLYSFQTEIIKSSSQ